MPTYLDHAATTSVRPEVAQELARSLRVLGNPGSVHLAGQSTRAELAAARERLAQAFGAHPSEVVFLSGGTEANNLGLKGLFEAHSTPTRNQIIVPTTEHHSVLDPLHWMVEHRGAELVWWPQSSDGAFSLDWLEAHLDEQAERVALATGMWVNNETGVINDVAGFAALADKFGVPFHTDAVAAAGHLEMNFATSGASTMAIAGHKFGAPIGTGALLVQRKARLTSLTQGGGAERELRAGTVSFPMAVALATAASLATEQLEIARANWQALAQRLIGGVLETVPGSALTAASGNRVPNIVNLTFQGVPGESLLFLLDQQGIQISNGSACTAGVVSISHVLQGMGFSDQLAGSAIRVSFGIETNEADIDALLAVLPAAVEQARKSLQ